jgi:DNA-directed RNA polymerase specialized sigma24 family protein
MLATQDFLDQSRLDDLAMEDTLVPRLRSHATVVFIPEALLDELSFVPPNQEPVSEARPQRKACHRLRKLVRSLNGRERKIIRFVYFRGMSHQKVSLKMGLKRSELEAALAHAFAKLREGLHLDLAV